MLDYSAIQMSLHKCLSCQKESRWEQIRADYVWSSSSIARGSRRKLVFFFSTSIELTKQVDYSTNDLFMLTFDEMSLMIYVLLTR